MKRIEEIDKNFRAAIPELCGMKVYDILEPPFRLYGLKYGEKGFYRMDTDIAEKVSDGVKHLNFNTAGGCLRFRTDSRKIAITVSQPDTWIMDHMPLTGSSGFSVYCDGGFCGVLRAPSADEYRGTWTGQLTLPSGDKDVMIFFPLYNSVKEIVVLLEENASLCEGNSFEDAPPIVFYGSSITQGGCASQSGNAYTNMIARGLNRETLNLGFSGSCLAEDVMCDYIATLPMSLLVYDYDHNAPDADFLEKTHERFFKRLRLLRPELPVLFISVADRSFGKESIDKRKTIIKRTYENALENSDKNVYFLDGQRFYDTIGAENATVDTCHPNDLGFWAFYDNISRFIKENDL